MRLSVAVITWEGDEDKGKKVLKMDIRTKT